MRKFSILFYTPDYHCTFFYRDQLRKLGWRADIFVPPGYPEKLLYSHEDILKVKKFFKKDTLNLTIWLFWTIIKYRYVMFYGRPPDYSFFYKKLGILKNRDPLLDFLRLFRKKIIYLGSGCRDEFTREDFLLFDNGNVCGNCGFYDLCDEVSNKQNINKINKYADLVVGSGFTFPKLKKYEAMFWKSFNFDSFNSQIEIPSNFILPETGNIRILHMTNLIGRNLNGKNIKGSQYVIEAVHRLRNEGYPCELINVHDVKLNEMIFYQIQADIIVDQLIYGHWGSSSLEGVALEKPVVCYFNKEMKDNYIKSLKIDTWPFIEANTNDIYEILKDLVTDSRKRQEAAMDAFKFSRKYLDIKKNSDLFIEKLEFI